MWVDSIREKNERAWRGVSVRWISTKEELPEEGVYVLVHVENRPWFDEVDQEGCRYAVASLVRGITMEQRSELADGDPRKITYSTGDVHGNNHVPYAWERFGPGDFFGQEVERWMRFPRFREDEPTR